MMLSALAVDSSSTRLTLLNWGSASDVDSFCIMELALTLLITLTAGTGTTPNTMNRIPSAQVIRLKIINDFLILPSTYFFNILKTY
jgi:hypothetical protein